MSAPRENYYRIGSSVIREYRVDDHRLAAFYILTCDHRTTEGLFRMPLGYAAADLGWKPRRVDTAFGHIFSSGLAEYDHDAEVCLIPKALKWQAPANPNSIKAAIKKLAAVPPTYLFVGLYLSAQRYCQPFAEQLAEQFPERIRDHSISTSISDSHTPGVPVVRVCVSDSESRAA